MACGIFPDQVSNLWLLQWKHRVLAPDCPGRSYIILITSCKKKKKQKTKKNKDILQPHPWFTGTSCVPHPEAKLAFLGFYPEEIQMHL